MPLDLNNPTDFALAMDRRTAGMSPTLGPTESRRRVHQARQDLVDKLQCQRRVDELQCLRDASRKRPSPLKMTSPPIPLPTPPSSSSLTMGAADLQKGERYTNMDFILFKNLEKTRAKKPPAPPAEYEDDEETKAIAQRMLDAYVADGTDPLVTMLEPFDDMSSEEEYDPNCGLPYVPQLKIDRRRADAVLMISGTLAQLESERLAADSAARTMQYYSSRFIPWPHVHAMKQVAAEIHDLGATKRSMERVELGPAPHGFSYVQLENQVYLVADDGDGSMVYIAEASTVLICRRP
ncbi:hypothetical protein FB451DRAFT_1419022 [Mycena latifolia]|nr:hypothetical protein FB451DRAFT_1419022 [Mycena latifolia]